MTVANLVLSMIKNLNKNLSNKQINPIENKLKKFRLENDMEVLLIHNPLFKDSAVMLTVDAGSIYDPCKIPGLAHLVEHLIFCGSEKYSTNGEWMDFQNKKGGIINGMTSLEKMDIFSQSADEDFEKSLDYFLDAVTKPLMRKEDCLKEIELIEHEWKIRNSELNIKLVNLINFLTDETFYESRFISGNIKSLKIVGIEKEVKNFHSTYFKANRMKLVIKSKFSLDKLTKFAEIFNCVPTELENEYIPHLEKKIKKKNGIGSLLNHFGDIKLKEEFRGKIIKYNGQKNNVVANLYFAFPSHLRGYTKIHFEYLKEIISKDLKQKFNENPFLKNIQSYRANYKRKNNFLIVLDLSNDNSEEINKVISTIYNYLTQLKPNEKIFEKVKKDLITKYQKNMNESVVLKTYSYYLFLYSSHKLGEIEAKIQYNDNIFTDMVERFSDIKNWTVFVSTNDSNLPNCFPNYVCSFGNPIPIILKSAEQTFYDNNELQDYQTVPELKTDICTNVIDFPETELKIIHVKKSFGEYTLIHEKKLLGQECEIILSFISPSDTWKNHSNDLFNYALAQKISTLLWKNRIEAKIKIQKFYCFDNNLNLKIKKEEICKVLKILKNQLKNFKLNNSEIDKAKNFEINEYQSIEKSNKQSELLYLSNIILPNLIKKTDLRFVDNYDFPIQFNENYYLSVTAVGDLTEKEVLKIYETLKSTGGSLENYYKLSLNDKSFWIKSNNSVDNSLTMAYHISAESKVKEFAIANILKIIFRASLNRILKCENGFSYSNCVDYSYVRQQPFLVFSLRTLKNVNLIENEIKNMMATYSEKINEISENDLNSFKKKACKIFEWKINSKENLSHFALLTTLVGIYDGNFKKIVKEAINSITIQELKDLHDKFTNKPVVIYGINGIKN